MCPLCVVLICIAHVMSEVEHHFHILRGHFCFPPYELSVHILHPVSFGVSGLLLIGSYEFFIH